MTRKHISKNKKDKLFDMKINGQIKQIKSTLMVAKLGNFMTGNKSESNKWKKRMLEAGLADLGLSFPDDWDSLSEQEKEERLDKVINFNLAQKDRDA